MAVPGRSRGGFVQQFVQHFELLGCCHPGQGEPGHHVPARAQAAASASAAGAIGGGPALARSEWRTLAERLRPALPRKLDSVPPPVGGAIVTTSGRALAWVGTMSPANRVGYVMKYCKTFVRPGLCYELTGKPILPIAVGSSRVRSMRTSCRADIRKRFLMLGQVDLIVTAERLVPWMNAGPPKHAQGEVAEFVLVDGRGEVLSIEDGSIGFLRWLGGVEGLKEWKGPSAFLRNLRHRVGFTVSAEKLLAFAAEDIVSDWLRGLKPSACGHQRRVRIWIAVTP